MCILNTGSIRISYIAKRPAVCGRQLNYQSAIMLLCSAEQTLLCLTHVIVHDFILGIEESCDLVSFLLIVVLYHSGKDRMHVLIVAAYRTVLLTPWL